MEQTGNPLKIQIPNQETQVDLVWVLQTPTHDRSGGEVDYKGIIQGNFFLGDGSVLYLGWGVGSMMYAFVKTHGTVYYKGWILCVNYTLMF